MDGSHIPALTPQRCYLLNSKETHWLRKDKHFRNISFQQVGTLCLTHWVLSHRSLSTKQRHPSAKLILKEPCEMYCLSFYTCDFIFYSACLHSLRRNRWQPCAGCCQLVLLSECFISLDNIQTTLKVLVGGKDDDFIPLLTSVSKFSCEKVPVASNKCDRLTRPIGLFEVILSWPTGRKPNPMEL